ncbi:hypothetical protein HaLaN_16381, partial [Haematococcus lacustris]
MVADAVKQRVVQAELPSLQAFEGLLGSFAFEQRVAAEEAEQFKTKTRSATILNEEGPVVEEVVLLQGPVTALARRLQALLY